jgi:zinc transporter ZupT
MFMKHLQTAVLGCIAVLAISLIPHIVENVYALLFAGVLLLVVIWIAHKVGEHFHHGHTHEGDSDLDTSIGITLIAVNILHPMVDGFALSGTYLTQGKYIFVSVLAGIAIHEIFRQSALIVIFRQFGFKGWKVILPALGGMAFGWLFGTLGRHLPQSLEPYIDAVTFNAYAFIVAEQLFAHKGDYKKRGFLYALVFGIVIAGIFITFFKAH